MAGHITMRKAKGTYSIRAAGAVLGESKNVIELSEGGLPEILYVPREDLAMAFFDKTDHTSTCPHKGTASYYTIQAKSGPIANAAWSYEAPHEGLEQIAGHLAFYPDFVTVEQV
jgi:uncharacterized protein (DUF427 family)